MNTRRQQRKSAAGFTLVELLVVVVIIVILAGLTVPAVMLVISKVNATRIGSEIAQIQNVIEDYSQRMGDHPPDFTDPNVVKLHLNKCYPNNKETTTTITTLCSKLDAGEALVFILRGIKNDPIFPLSGAGAPVTTFNFTQTRFAQDVDGDGYQSYNTPAGVPSPYLYFDIRGNLKTYNGEDGSKPVFTAYTVGTDYKPYQIVSAGLDGDFGTGNSVTSTTPGDQDNVANFTEGKTIADFKPQ